MGPVISKRKETGVLAAATDEQLFLLMKNRGLDPENGNAAWGEFYRRYAKYLWKCCLIQCSSLPDGEEVAMDIFQATMEKIYDRANNFHIEKNSGLKGYISRIAQNEFHNYFKKYHLNFSNEEYPETEDSSEDHEAEIQIPEIKFENLKQMLSKLSPKEYKVLITCMNYYQIDNPNSHLPDEEIKKLCIEFNIAPATIRQIKKRSLQKLKDFAKLL